MSTSDRPAPQDALDLDFERRLLASAREDNVTPEATRAAWDRFAAASAAAASLVGPTPEALRAVATSKAFAASRASKWLLVGALGGSAVTAAWLGLPRDTSPRVPAAALSATAAAPVPPRPSPTQGPILAEETATPTLPLPTATTRIVPVPLRPVRSVPLGPDVPPSPPVAHGRAQPALSTAASDPHETQDDEPGRRAVHGRRSPSLSAEVAALDQARAASAAGSFGTAIRLIDAYHRQFPEGALRADAEVIALDALAASHDRAGVLQRAARFLAQHPNDPHAAHVAKLSASQR